MDNFPKSVTIRYGADHDEDSRALYVADANLNGIASGTRVAVYQLVSVGKVTPVFEPDDKPPARADSVHTCMRCHKAHWGFDCNGVPH